MLARHFVVVAVTILYGSVATAADHQDSPAAVAEPTADIADFFAWMSADASKVNVVVTVNAFASASSAFSPAVQYAVHFGRASAYGAVQTDTQLICQFYSSQNIECWLENEYVEGDPSARAGIASASGMLKVFAGLTDDPFFFELSGFDTALQTVRAATGLTADAHGCPQLDDATAAVLRTQLTQDSSGGPASNTLAGANVLTLAIEVDKSVLNGTGPILGLWASTHAAN